LVARQAGEGRVNGVVVDLGLDAVHDLRSQLRPNKSIMYPDTYARAMRFLDRAERGLNRFKRMETPPRDAGADRGKEEGVASRRDRD
jgi:hypothetical protein